VYDTQGNEKNVMFHKAPFYDSQGQIAGLVGAMLDITEMKKTQKKLEESEQRHRLLFSSAKDALFLLAPPDWAFVDANPSAVELFGAESREQLIRRFPLEISPEHQPDGTKSSEKSLEMIRKAVEEGAHLFEWTHRTFDGNEFPAEVLLTSMSFDGRNYLLASVRNVTARKHAEEAIAEARDQAESEAAKLSAMISGMEDGLLFVDRDDRVVEVNEAFCRLLGKDRQEIQDRPLESLELEKHIENFSNHLSAFRKQRLTEPCVCQTRLPDAEVIFRVLPIYRHRSFDGILISCIDITELADAKERLEASNRELEKSIARSHQLAEQSEMASKAKSEFLANMSHEIRTPMTAILGYTDLILESNKDPDTRNAASTIQRNGRHLLEIINDVLDLAKVESGKQKVELRRCSPHQVVDEVISMLRVQTEGKGLSLDVEYATPIPETIETDPARLRQILLNLIGNAIKFTELGGVTLKISLLQPPEGSARLRFNVIDTGIGMSKQQIAQLFQPFFQLDCSLSRKYGGTGLGLTISKHFAYMLGGDLTVQSQLGQGSDFLLTIETGSLEGIPMLDNVQEIEMRLPEEEKEKPIEPGMLSGRILLAEDGPDNQRLISLLLKKAGAQVELAENGQQAVERIEANGRKNDDAEEPLPPIDLILMDIQMPVLDGLEATRTLREQGYTNPILALTAHAMEQDIEKCRLAGCDGHLTKPIQRNLFFETIRKSLKRSRSAEGQPED
jgi:PAS domain S-box-containing protein